LAQKWALDRTAFRPNVEALLEVFGLAGISILTEGLNIAAESDTRLANVQLHLLFDWLIEETMRLREHSID
jgi:hypothetical protein